MFKPIKCVLFTIKQCATRFFFLPKLLYWIHKILFTTGSICCMEQEAQLLLNFKGFKISWSCKEDLNLIAVELSYKTMILSLMILHMTQTLVTLHLKKLK